ncbi:MAG TPA: hypothetical protein VFS51_04920 [Gemmatimonadales bacterium]|nr:hypothetical protein [Gemmatimonadales bacterium]
MKRALDKNALEWIVFAVGLILVAATLVYLIREASTRGSSPPELVVDLGSPQQVAEGFQVPVTVVNRGERVAQDVSVTITLAAGTEREEAVLTIGFLPHQSRHDGWVTFRGDPKEGNLEVGPVGYASP